MRSIAAALSLFLALGCTKAGSTSEHDGTGARPGPPPQPQTVDKVDVDLSSVTLGNDCGGRWTPPPPKSAPAQPAHATGSGAPAAVSPSAPARREPGAVPESSYSSHSCQQTSIQLALHATGTGAPIPIRIKKVELLDSNGKYISDLTASGPTRWSAAGTYDAWDQNVGPGEDAAVSYVLSSPVWYQMEGGQYAQTGKTFQVRVTLLVGSKDRVVEKQAIQPTIMAPPVPT